MVRMFPTCPAQTSQLQNTGAQCRDLQFPREAFTVSSRQCPGGQCVSDPQNKVPSASGDRGDHPSFLLRTERWTPADSRPRRLRSVQIPVCKHET